MKKHQTPGRLSMHKGMSRRVWASASMAAMAASLMYAGAAHADPAVYFNEDATIGIQKFKDTVDSADAAYNAANPGSTRSSLIYEYDILSTSGSSFMVIGPNAGDPSVIVETSRGGSAASNNGTGNEGSDGFTNWGNSYSKNAGFSAAEAMGYTYKFYEADGTTPFEMNAIGTMVNDWGTCCAVDNATPDGGTADASQVYLRFGSSNPLLLGGISSTIGPQEHFIGAINDTNFFNEVTVIANGNGEYFGVGGYLVFSTVALNSVPAGSSDVDDSLSGGGSIPDIDMAATYYTARKLADGAVNPNFVGGTLMFGMNTSVNTSFTVQNQGGTIDTENNIVVAHGSFSGSGAMNKTGSGLLVLSGTNTQAGGFSVSQGTLQASSDSNLGGGPLTIGNATFQAGGTFSSSRQMIVQHENATFDVLDHSVLWNGAITGAGGFHKRGRGMLMLTGNSQMTGNSYVDEGTLSVNGMFGSNLLTVNDGATLKGTGNVNSDVMVLSGGELSPGNSPGTLYVSGDVTLNQGSIFRTEIDGNVYSAAGGAGSYDRLVLTGEGATFTAAGSINPILRGISGNANNNYTPVMGDIFTVVTADNVVGTFNDVVQPASGLAANTRLKVIYNDDSVQLALVANSLGLASMTGGMRGNAVTTGLTLDYATANGQNATGELSDLLDRFDGLNETQVANAVRSLSGDMHAHIIESTESVLIGSDDMIISAARGEGGLGGLSKELDNGIRLWTRAEARGASYDPDGYTWGFDEDVYGMTVGATLLNKDGMKAGIAGSYKTVDLYNDTADGATTHMLSLYGYGSRAVTTRLTLSGLVGYTHASAKVSRTSELGTIASHSRAKQDIGILHAQAEARYKVLERGATSAFAIAGVRTAVSNIDAYDERGDLEFTQLSLGGESRNTLQSKLGAEIAHTVAKTDLALFGNWTRDIGADPKVEREVSLGNAIWQTASVRRGLDTYNYGVRASRDVTDRIGVEIEYTGRYNSPNYDAQQLMIGVNFAW